MTRVDFAKCLAVLEAATGKPFTEEAAEVWFSMLGDLELDALQAAVKRYLLESEFPGLPPIGKLRRMATEHVHGVSMTPEAAFAIVRQAILYHGYASGEAVKKMVGPEIWEAILGIGGWGRICDNPVDQRQALFAQFRDAFLRISERRTQALRLPDDIRPRITQHDPEQVGAHTRALVKVFKITDERESA